MLTLLAKLFAALNSEDSPIQISFGFAFGMILGLTPTMSLHNLIVLFLVLLFRVNLGGFFLSFAFFSLFSLAFNPIAASLGETLLNHADLAGFWQAAYQITAMKLAHFHHTLTLGSLVIALAAFAPLIFLSQFLIKKYRVTIKAHIEKFKIIQWLKASRFYRIYQGVTGV